MKQFDLELAKQGAKVVTRDGKNVTILSFDVKDSDYPIVGIVHIDDETDEVVTWKKDGREGYNSDTDLFLVKTVKYGLYDKEEQEMASYYLYDRHQDAVERIAKDFDESRVHVIEINI